MAATMAHCSEPAWAFLTVADSYIEDDLYASAELAGDALNRSASQQIAHWARIGREIQASASISHREIVEGLAGRVSYDGLDPKEQVVVRAEWAERMAVYREELDLTKRFKAQGQTWVELDDDGLMVERGRRLAKSVRPTAKKRNQPRNRRQRVLPHLGGRSGLALRTDANPVLHLLAGPNGARTSTLYETSVRPATHLEFVNADSIAAALIGQRRSFVTETVFSHVSKLELLRAARTSGYLVTLHVVMVPEVLAVARVTSRVASGGPAVPEQKILERYRRLWPLVAEAIKKADNCVGYDDTRTKTAFRVVASFERGLLISAADWPWWTPKIIRDVDG